MNKIQELGEVKLVCITVRTSNAKEMNFETAMIGAKWQKYFEKKYPEKIAYRIKPGITYGCIHPPV